jgi:hypothetical protein
MKPTKETYIAAVAFASLDGLDEVSYDVILNGCVVYYATCEAEAGACVGYPHFVIVNEKLECRYATPEECLEIMDLEQ